MTGIWTAAPLAPPALPDSELAPEPGTAPPLARADAQTVAREVSCEEPSCQPRDWHAGLNLRTDFGTHPLRLDGGVRFGRLDTYLVLDPMFFLDGQADIDAVADFGLGRG